jgi:hypothetical protein
MLRLGRVVATAAGDVGDAAGPLVLEAHARRLYATVTDPVRAAAALLASRMVRGRLASPSTAREVYRNDWTGLTEPRVVREALESLRELGWIRSEAVIARDGGRPAVRFHINPRVADRWKSHGGFGGFVGQHPTGLDRADRRRLEQSMGLGSLWVWLS